VTPRTDQATRIIGASPSAIYQAFEDPRAMEAWLPPEGMTGRMLAFDFRDGGYYRMRLTYDDATHAPGKSSEDSDDVDVRFIELIEDRCIQQEVTFDSQDPAFAGVMKMTWTFLPTPSGTRVTVRCDNVPDGISREDHVAGLTSTLEKLAKFTE
jgi:uncharacterized protein YndB with AHSA1/START domain